jgi:hypothetical protein
MQQLSIKGSEQVSRNKPEEMLTSAEQSTPPLLFKPLAAKDRAPGLMVRTQLKAGFVFAKIQVD